MLQSSLIMPDIDYFLSSRRSRLVGQIGGDVPVSPQVQHLMLSDLHVPPDASQLCDVHVLISVNFLVAS
jgi:hypothetical protein